MPDVVNLPGRVLIMGDKKVIGVQNVRDQFNASLAGTTGIVEAFDSSGTVVLTSTALTMAFTVSNTRCKATYALVTNSSPFTVVQTLTFFYRLTFPDGSVYTWKEQIDIQAFS